MKAWIGHPGRLAVSPCVAIKHLDLAGGELVSRSVGAGMQYIVHLVPLAVGWQSPFRGRLASECSVPCIWCHLERVGRVHFEVGRVGFGPLHHKR